MFSFCLLLHTGLPTKDETVKTTLNPSTALNIAFNGVLNDLARESYLQDTRQYTFRTVVSEVSSFVGNPVVLVSFAFFKGTADENNIGPSSHRVACSIHYTVPIKLYRISSVESDKYFFFLN